MTPWCIRLLTQLLIAVFQFNITPLCTGADTRCVFQCYKILNHVPLSETICTVADYTLNEAKLETTHESKYLGAINSSDLEFTTNIKQQVARATQQLGMIKWALNGATKTSQAACVHIPASFTCWKCLVSMEPCPREPNSWHRNGSAPICQVYVWLGMKWIERADQLDNLRECRNKSRHNFFTNLSNEKCGEALPYLYDKLMNIALHGCN